MIDKTKAIVDGIATGWAYLCCGFVSAVLLAIFIFGGEVSIKINWHSWVDLWNHFKKH